MDLKRRRTLLRTTALPTFRFTTNPNRVSASGSRLRACTTRNRPGFLAPRRTTSRKSVSLRRRCLRGSTALLRRKFAAALGATSRQDRPTRTGTHPESESVLFGAAAVVWLERTLRHYSLRRHSHPNDCGDTLRYEKDSVCRKAQSTD